MTNREAIETLGELKKCYLGGIVDAIDMAIEAVKAQEPVKPIIICGNWWYQCGKCKEAVGYHDKYCKACGQAVKWE